MSPFEDTNAKQPIHARVQVFKQMPLNDLQMYKKDTDQDAAISSFVNTKRTSPEQDNELVNNLQ